MHSLPHVGFGWVFFFFKKIFLFAFWLGKFPRRSGTDDKTRTSQTGSGRAEGRREGRGRHTGRKERMGSGERAEKETPQPASKPRQGAKRADRRIDGGGEEGKPRAAKGLGRQGNRSFREGAGGAPARAEGASWAHVRWGRSLSSGAGVPK